MPGFWRVPGGGGGGSFPGFGGAPPAVASASSAGAAALASRSDHTHALDLVTYSPSVAGMQASGVVQQTWTGPAPGTAVPAAFAVATGLVPFGASGILATDALFTFITGTHRLYLSNGGAPDTSGLIGLINSQVENSASANADLSRNTSDTTGVFVRTDKSRGSRAVPTAVVAGDLTFTFSGRAYSGTAYIQSTNWGFLVPTDATITATSVPQTFFIAGNGGTNPGSGTGAWGFAVTSARNVFLGDGGLTTASTDGFAFAPATTGNPAGTPTYVFGGSQVLNRVPFQFSTTAPALWFYSGGAWHSIAPPTLAIAYANGLAGTPAVDNALAGTVATTTFDTNAFINVKTNVGQEANTAAFVNLTHVVAGNNDLLMDTQTVEYNVASGVNTLALATPTGWRRNYVLKLDASASTFQAGHERIVMGNSVIGGSPWYTGSLSTTETPFVAKELGVMTPDGSTERVHQWVNTGTYAHAVYSPISSGANIIVASELSILNAAAGGTPTVGGGTGWFVYANFGISTDPLAMLNMRLTAVGSGVETSVWDFWTRNAGTTTRVATIAAATGLTIAGVVAPASTALALTGNAASSWTTSSGALTLQSNTGGTLGTTSTEIILGAGTDITVVGNLVQSTAGNIGKISAPWPTVFATTYDVVSSGVAVVSMTSTGTLYSAAAGQSITKTGGTLSIGTTDAHDVSFEAAGGEVFRLVGALTQWQDGTSAGAPSSATGGLIWNNTSKVFQVASDSGIFTDLSRSWKFSDRFVGTTTGNVYLSDAGQSITAIGTASSPQYPMPACRAYAIRAYVDANAGATGFSFTLYKNNVATSLKVTYAGGATGYQVDTTAAHAVTFADGDRMSVVGETGAGPGGTVTFAVVVLWE